MPEKKRCNAKIKTIYSLQGKVIHTDLEDHYVQSSYYSQHMTCDNGHKLTAFRFDTMKVSVEYVR